MTQLIRYEALKSALAEALTVDEVKDIRDKAEAMRAYARLANDVELELDAAEYRVRAERKLGLMLKEQRRTVGLGKPGPKINTDEEFNSRPSLGDVGIEPKLSARAQKLAELPEEAVEAGIQRVREKARGGKRYSLDIAAVDKKERRAQRERELAEKQSALPTKRYGVIYADPEWRFEPYSRETGMDRAADNHYPTSVTDEIAARPVQDIAADDCVLFLWATVPMLPDALRVMKAWGFAYKSHFIWHKDIVGTGYWNRNKHELLLVGTRGHIPAPAAGTQALSVINAPQRRHSEKPVCFYALIENHFPNLPKIELNARIAREGWDAWGLEAPPHDPETGEILEDTEAA